jgi:hypothetical protein
MCVALDEPLELNREQARSLCRSCDHQSCRRFREASSPDRASNAATIDQSVQRRLVGSALWVIGIPVAITLMIVLALWLTEHVWLSTQTAIMETYW